MFHPSVSDGDDNSAYQNFRDNSKKKEQEICDHEFVTYKVCPRCGTNENYKGDLITHVSHYSNVRELSDKFSEWYFAYKKEKKPPLAMQIFWWFHQNLSLYETLKSKEEIEQLTSIVELKEKERKEWSELAIRKQSIIQSALENIILGNIEEVHRVLTQSISPS